MFPGFGINNIAGVVLNQSFAVTINLYLTLGSFSTSNSSILTLGNGSTNTLSTYVGDAAGGELL